MDTLSNDRVDKAKESLPMNTVKHIFSKQQRPTMTQIAADNIRMAIERGHLKLGSRIIESQLSKELGMSRFPIREALCYLEKEGLVQTVPFKGVSVVQITPKDIQDLMVLRCSLEELAIRLAIQRLTPDKIGRLRRIMKTMENALDENSKEDILDADLSFHQSICEFADNSRLLNAWLPLASQIRVYLHLEYHLFQTAKEFVATHEPLLSVIESRDEKKALEAIRDHLIGPTNKLFSRNLTEELQQELD